MNRDFPRPSRPRLACAIACSLAVFLQDLAAADTSTPGSIPIAEALNGSANPFALPGRADIPFEVEPEPETGTVG